MLERAQRLARLSKGNIKVAEPEARKAEVIGKTEPPEVESQVKALLEASRAMKARAARGWWIGL